MGKKRSNPVFLDKLPEGARALTLRNNIIVNRLAKKDKYPKEKHIFLCQSYDFLQNFIVVRVYIQKRYKIELYMIELLLYLYPLNYFTEWDYTRAPRRYSVRRVKDMIRLEMVTLAVQGKKREDNLYTLSLKAKSIVRHFYECLSGEKKINENPRFNPLADKNANNFDKSRFKLIKHLNQMEVPESKKNMI